MSVLGALAGDPESTDTATLATEEQQASPAKATPTTEAPESPGIGSPVRDGKFEFTVGKVDCGKSRIGSVDFGVRAQGQFCLV